MQAVAAFTDTYLPTVNGVTYTVRTWRERWARRGGRMDVVYPASSHEPDRGEHPVGSVNFPFYEGFRMAAPRVPAAVDGADLVHAHTPFLMGLAGRRLARRRDVPLVASYHTPTAEYADYLANGRFSRIVEASARAYERWYLDGVDAVVVPSEPARAHLREVGVSAAIHVVPNGVDVERFEPVDPAGFRERHGLPERPLVGYTGRHGYEKNLSELLAAADHLESEVTVVLAGDGPARGDLEAIAADVAADVRFLGFLDREELPAFYSALSVFAFPSPVETQGIVALEANACGTPVVGVDSGALEDTVIEGETGYHYDPGDVAGFAAGIERALAEHEALSEHCLARREPTSVEHAIDGLEDVYAQVLED